MSGFTQTHDRHMPVWQTFTSINYELFLGITGSVTTGMVLFHLQAKWDVIE